MTPWRGWALVVLMLAVAAAVALCPAATVPRAKASVRPWTVRPHRWHRTSWRRAIAALQPCRPSTAAAQVSGPLTGVRTVCLGDGSPVDLGATLAGQPTLINGPGPPRVVRCSG